MTSIQECTLTVNLESMHIFKNKMARKVHKNIKLGNESSFGILVM